MENNLFTIDLDVKLKFYPPLGDLVNANAKELKLTKDNQKINACYLTFEVDYVTYKLIEFKELFQLRSDLKGAKIGGDFDQNQPLKITAIINPDLLEYLQDYTVNNKKITEYFQSILEDKGDKNSPFLQTNNWGTLSVKQDKNGQEIGYRTFWDYLNPSQLFSQQKDVVDDLISETMISFLQETRESENLGLNNPEILKSTQELLNNLLKKTPTDSNDNQQSAANAMAQLLINSTYSQLSDLIENEIGDEPELFMETVLEELLLEENSTPILSTAVEFFKEEDWEFEKVEHQSKTILRAFFQGKNDRLVCLLEVKEKLQQLIFYSISSIKIPEENRKDICEFLMRVNHFLTIGNFDLDFNDGEIRFRTSIDVEGSQIDTALVKNIVYTNVLTMDKYLSGVISLIETNDSIENILHKI